MLYISVNHYLTNALPRFRLVDQGSTGSFYQSLLDREAELHGSGKLVAHDNDGVIELCDEKVDYSHRHATNGSKFESDV